RVRETLMHRPPAQNPKAIIGKTGRLTSDLKAGEVATANIGAEDFTVTGSSDLPNGTLVKVKDLQGLRLIVEKMENRSEERRVGKECRARWLRSDLREKVEQR